MKISAYLSIAVIAFLGFLIAFAPASVLWSVIEKDVSRAVPDLKVMSVGGSIWSGKTEIQFRQFPSSRLSWTISPLNILSGTGSIRIIAEGNGHSMELEADATPSEVDMKIPNGNLSSDYINRVSEQYGLIFAGNLSFNEVFMATREAKLVDATGFAHWTGGRVFVAGQSQPLDLPPLNGELLFADQLLVLNVTYQQLSMIKISLNEQGWATIAIKGRFFDIADLPRPDSTNPDETILLLEEKIL